MKNKLFLFALVAVIGAFVAFSFDKPDAAFSADGVAVSDNGGYYAVGEYVAFDYRIDTLTNAESNTLTIGRRDNTVWNTVTTPTNFLSLYTMDIKVKTASLSGTHSVKVALDACDKTSGTSSGWVGIDSITTTAANSVQLRLTDVTATRYRLRVSGTGTMSSTYEVDIFCKKKN